MSDVHSNHIFLPAKISAPLGFATSFGVKLLNELQATASGGIKWPSDEAMFHAFVLGLVGAFGGLCVTLGSKLVKYIWDNRKTIVSSTKQRWQAEESELGKILKKPIARTLGAIGVIGGFLTESNFMAIQQYLPPIVYKIVVICAAITFIVGKLTKKDECKEEREGQTSQQGS